MTPWQAVEAVRSWHSRGSVVYWRMVSEGRHVGAISRLTADGGLALRQQDTVAWRALAYSATERPPNGNVDLGRFATRREAEGALRDHLIARSPQ